MPTMATLNYNNWFFIFSHLHITVVGDINAINSDMLQIIKMFATQSHTSTSVTLSLTKALNIFFVTFHT